MGIYDRDYYQDDEFRPLRPWDNKSMVTLIIIANVAVYVANFLFGGQTSVVTNALTLEPAALWTPYKWWQLVTYGFCHDPKNIGHVLFNMASLYFLGRSVEDRLGKWEFFRYYMLAIILCGVVWCGMHNGRNEVLLGASGATTAVSMLFVFCYPNSTIMFMMAVPMKAWVLGVLIIVGNLFTPTSFNEEGGSSVAYDVHLTGAAFAAVYFFAGLNLGFLGSFWGDMRQSIKLKRSGLKVHREEEAVDVKPSADELESDRILDKIHREGQESLSAKERKFMERYSRQVRERRQQ